MLPTLYPTRPEVQKRLADSGLNENLLFIAACEACMPNVKTKTVAYRPKSLRAKLKEIYPGQDISVYERECRKSPKKAAAILGDAAVPDDTNYYWGKTPQRETSGNVPVAEVARTLGVDLSRRMVCYYRKQWDHRRAVKLMIDILGDSLPRHAHTGSFTTVRPDLMRVVSEAEASPTAPKKRVKRPSS